MPGTTPGGRDRGRQFGEETLEALIWSAVEEELLSGRWDAIAFGAGLEAWGRELLGRWHAEVSAFVEAYREDEAAGRLEPWRPPPVPTRLARPQPGDAKASTAVATWSCVAPIPRTP